MCVSEGKSELIGKVGDGLKKRMTKISCKVEQIFFLKGETAHRRVTGGGHRCNSTRLCYLITN